MSRAGEPPSTPPVAWIMASGATSETIDEPSGCPTSVSSATEEENVLRAPVSRSVAWTRTGTVGGGAPARPATASSASLLSVPSVCPGAASLYVPEAGGSTSGELMTRKT